MTDAPALRGHYRNHWHRVYQRNNKANGIKNIRCFPSCTIGDDGTYQHSCHGHCGASVVLDVESDAPLAAVAFACFGLVEGQDGEPAVGDTFTWDELLEKCSSPELGALRASDPAAIKIQAALPWFPVALTRAVSCDPPGSPSAAAAAPASAAAPGAWRNRFEIDRANKKCTMGWHYGWISSRHTKGQAHVLNTLVFEVPASAACRHCGMALLSSSEQRALPRLCPHCGAEVKAKAPGRAKRSAPKPSEGELFTLRAIFRSPPFQLFSSRRGPHSEAKFLLSEHQRKILELESMHALRRSRAREVAQARRVRERIAGAPEAASGGGASGAYVASLGDGRGGAGTKRGRAALEQEDSRAAAGCNGCSSARLKTAAAAAALGARASKEELALPIECIARATAAAMSALLEHNGMSAAPNSKEHTKKRDDYIETCWPRLAAHVERHAHLHMLMQQQLLLGRPGAGAGAGAGASPRRAAGGGLASVAAAANAAAKAKPAGLMGLAGTVGAIGQLAYARPSPTGAGIRLSM
eukprot:g6725.t1